MSSRLLSSPFTSFDSFALPYITAVETVAPANVNFLRPVFSN